nr:sugar transferase [Aequorivita capsosiphonis]
MFKRLFDLTFSIIGLLVFGWLILLFILITVLDSGSYPLFFQKRIGQYGKPFNIFKIRTVHAKTRRISTYGRFLRNSKLDELPQLINILFGQMSFVGPRPDIPGYYNSLQGEARKLLQLKPGLCSMAAIKYHNEETLLAQQLSPMDYNNKVIFPDKVAMNLDYYHRRSIGYDIHILRMCAKKTIKVFL